MKTDLLRTTVDARNDHGEVKVFDPFGVSGRPTTTWSPLRAARNLEGAKAAASLLAHTHAEASPNDTFWRGQAEQLLAAMLWTAANTEGHTMRKVVKWVLELDRPGDGNNGTLAPLVRLLTDDDDEETALAAHQVQGWLQGQWKTDARTTSSVYATRETPCGGPTPRSLRPPTAAMSRSTGFSIGATRSTSARLSATSTSASSSPRSCRTSSSKPSTERTEPGHPTAASSCSSTRRPIAHSLG